MAAEVKQLVPVREVSRIYSDEKGTAAVFVIAGFDGVVLQIADVDGLGAWPTSLSLAVEVSIDGANWADFPSGAINYTGFGVQASLVVTGLMWLRVVVETDSSAAHGYVGVLASGVKEVG